MDILDLIKALLAYDALTARQWLADAERAGFIWSKVPPPFGLDPTERALAAGVTELLASRAGQAIFLVRAAETLPRLRALCEREGPEPLRRRGLLAPPEFLTVA